MKARIERLIQEAHEKRPRVEAATTRGYCWCGRRLQAYHRRLDVGYYCEEHGVVNGVKKRMKRFRRDLWILMETRTWIEKRQTENRCKKEDLLMMIANRSREDFV